ncbi:MAG: hypothetical protein WBO24_10735 [Nitrospirales bacterium]
MLNLKKGAVPLLYLTNDSCAEHVFPGTLDVFVILPEGDEIFPPGRIQRSGLWDGLMGRVLIYMHKEQMLQSIEQRYSDRHYILVDNKLRILATIKDALENRLTTGFSHQSHYAFESGNIAACEGAQPTPTLR